jgi:AcrR family transcriptional regulator
LPEKDIRTYSGDEELVSKRRGHIAKKAVKVFLKKGYEKTTMRDLGKACGMAPGSLYHYISSKTDILHLICVNTAVGAEPYRELRGSLGDVSYTRLLGECMALFFQVTDSVGESLLFFNRQIHKFSREDRQRLLASTASIVTFFEELIREGTKAGELQTSDPTLVAHNILMCGHDWVLRDWFLKQHYSLEAYSKKQIGMVLKLIAA